jgi:hypothetical protein
MYSDSYRGELGMRLQGVAWQQNVTECREQHSLQKSLKAFCVNISV